MKNKDFAVFIMVYGRPDKNVTYNTLKRCGYTGKIFLLGDNTDSKIESYKRKYSDELLVFDKKEVSKKYDAGDNSGDLRSTMFAANIVFDLARENGIKYFCLMCDDYSQFKFRFENKPGFRAETKNIDNVFDSFIKFYKNTSIKSIAFSQGGDHIGGFTNTKLRRKAMNTFFCSIDRPFEFIGRLNEDVTSYVNLGSKGYVFFTFTSIQIDQEYTQKKSGGLTEIYKDNGTYVKSFFPVMYNPSSVKVSMINTKNPRLHHSIKWINTTPMIINEDYKKRIKNAQ
jgi:hypothetical protein